MHAEFSFFKAGQGSFYGGRIRSDFNKVYTVVYDCGTSSRNHYLNEEIDFFKIQGAKCNVIDLLFISHLDYDHVSGLKRLLKEFNVKKLFYHIFQSK